MKKKVSFIMLVIVLIVFSITITTFVVSGNSKKSSSKNGQAPAFKESATTNQAISKTIIIDGTVDFNKKIKYFVLEDGKTIVKLNVKVGDKINAGDKLVEFDKERLDTLKNQLKDEKLTLESLKLDISKLKTVDVTKTLQFQNDITSLNQQITEYEIAIKNNENQIQQAKSNLDNSNDSLKTTKELYVKGYSSQNDIKTLEDKISEYKNNIAKLTSDNENNKNMITIKKKLIDSDKQQLEIELNKEKDQNVAFQIQAKQNEIERAELKISQTEKDIKNFQQFTFSDISGVVTSVYVEEGQSVAKGKELVEIADNSDMIITANISEFDINKIKTGDKADITGDALDKGYKAYVSRIYPIANIDSNNNTVIPVEFKFIGLKKNIRNNYKVSIEITKGPTGESLMVPLSSIIRDDSGKSYVMVMRNGNKNNTFEHNNENSYQKKDEKSNKRRGKKDSAVKEDTSSTNSSMGSKYGGKSRPQKVEISTGEIKGNMVEVIGLDPTDKIVTINKSKSSNNQNKSFMQSITGQRGPGGPGGFGGGH